MTETFTARPLDFSGIAPDALRGLHASGQYLASSTLEPALRHLVNLRASQINGCAFCVALHVIEAEHDGEESRRLHGVVAWREASWYTARERAALAWTEALTLVADGHVPEDVYAATSAVFSERELIDLTLAVTTINAWNRFAIAFRGQPEAAAALYAQLHPEQRSA